jgi:ABC-type multidrug transport system fused ATPase/permease subunit
VTEETNVFGTADPQIKRVDQFVKNARSLYLKAQVLNRMVPNVYQSMIYLILVAGLLAASLAQVKGFSSLGAVVLLLIRAGTYGQQVQSAQVSLRQTLPFVERVQNAIDAYSASTPRRGRAPLQGIDTLSFENVEYFYTPERPVLRDVSFSVRGGETIGVIGPSGAGKSTIVQILLRLREPRSGTYRLNESDAFDIDFAHWHGHVAYVPQAPKLLHATVADNVRFFRDYDDAAVERACQLARIHDEIMEWPKGYGTIVGPRADAVSGGQQQRICLARALVANPSLLVLDEPTSALDPRSEALIQESLESMRSQLTLFIIAHRMSTLTICDRVMVVLNGTLDAFDTLPELTASNEYYQFASGMAASLSAPPIDVAAADGPPT